MAILNLGSTMVAQDIKGKYCLQYGVETTENCITFEGDYFIYEGPCSIGDLGSDFGVGHYTKDNNTLFLNFDLTNASFGDYHNTERSKTDKDFITFNIKVLDLDSSQAIPYANVIIDKKQEMTQSSNKDGFVSFTFKKSEIPKKVEIAFVGYKPYSFYLQSNYNYDVKVFMAKVKGCEIVDEVWEFKILKNKDNSESLKRLGKYKNQIWRSPY
ncbi:carboxypeptidase-like regulatory domain-containing protein [Aquimarina algicola]|uniref:Carboxypeptidase-like regulatory domain-containing protein n=1 Tax=Aquimarina algicola TaxID=2589995 RepID=A0A504JHV7_9FLAO|nr:carboxypeptidase-like regulatory domain-containing protein [Aquimarina algicola]